MDLAGRIARRVVAKLPWYWRQIISGSRTYLHFRKPPFEGVYERYEDAPCSDFYNSPTWVNASAAVTKDARDSNRPIPSASSRALLPAIVGSMNCPLRVLDFGGATGIDFAIVAQQNNNPDLSYTVVDSDAACDAGRSIWSNDPRISFMSELPEQGQFDIVYSCVSLHTVAKPLELLAKLVGFNPRIVLLTRTPFSDRAFVRSQVNMTQPLRQWVMSLPETVAMMKERGYELRLNVATEDKYNVENFPPEYAISGTRNLMFVRV